MYVAVTAAAAPGPRPVDTNIHQTAKATDSTPDNCSTEMVTLTTTVQHTMTGLQTAETQDDSIPVVMKVVYSFVIRE
jgi:hypothetical protein